MDNVEYRNAEGYADPTAYQAIKNIMAIKRGQMYYIRNDQPVEGNEIAGTRPGIVVSNNANNKHSGNVEIIYLTGTKKDLPTHVRIKCKGRISTALVEAITTVSVNRLGSYIGMITQQEQQEIDTAIKISLGLMMAPKKEAASCAQDTSRF